MNQQADGDKDNENEKENDSVAPMEGAEGGLSVGRPFGATRTWAGVVKPRPYEQGMAW